MLMRSPTTEPSLKNLAYVLRHKELWPEDFVWDYSRPESCGIGMCRLLYRLDPTIVDDRLDEDSANKIFMSWMGEKKYLFGLFKYPVHMRTEDITPEVVADRIDCWLAAH